MIRLKAHGLKPILDQWFPKLQAAEFGDFFPVAQGVSVRIPADLEISVQGTPDGTVVVDFPNGMQVQVGKTVLGILPFRATERIDSLDVTADSITVEGSLPTVRLEACP